VAPASPLPSPELPRINTPPVPPLAAVRREPPVAGTTSKDSTTLDAGAFPFTYYLRVIQLKIGERWSPESVTSGQRTVVLFEIQRNGQILEPVIEQSSGNALFDQSAIRAVTQASPFPPLPSEYAGTTLRVFLAFPSGP
jgi:TonB family protein